LLAAGIDPTRSILFVQSHVPEHAQLQWLLNAVSPLGDLERMTQFKDKAQRLESVPAGLLQYPVLQAADILLYRADTVPVGEDQAQHLELTREVARKWNQEYAPDQPFFPEPQALHTEAKRIIGLDGKAKMSKSLGNTISVTETAEEIWEKLRPTVTDPARVKKTDPGEPLKCPVIYPLHRYFSPPDVVELVERNCRGAGWGCIDCKRVLAEHLTAGLAPIRERVLALRSRPDEVDQILADGAARARAIARETLKGAMERMGFLGGRR
jgi:tryptophanyl-tRNA synthetase